MFHNENDIRGHTPFFTSFEKTRISVYKVNHAVFLSSGAFTDSYFAGIFHTSLLIFPDAKESGFRGSIYVQ
jgi:hypothetical protein